MRHTKLLLDIIYTRMPICGRMPTRKCTLGSTDVMGINVMRLITLWLVASAEALRVHSFVLESAHGFQGGYKKGRAPRAVSQANVENVCRVRDPSGVCQDLTTKFRGGGTHGNAN